MEEGKYQIPIAHSRIREESMRHLPMGNNPRESLTSQKVEYGSELHIGQHRWREMQIYLNETCRDIHTAQVDGKYNALVYPPKPNAPNNAPNIIMRENPHAAIDELVAIPYAKYKELAESLLDYNAYYAETSEIIGDNAQRRPAFDATFSGKPALPYTE